MTYHQIFIYHARACVAKAKHARENGNRTLALAYQNMAAADRLYALATKGR